tara:strand:+ start:3221 stop:4837 length:1617 start_codon:yes stop_codon:yes gene_type:complete
MIEIIFLYFFLLTICFANGKFFLSILNRNHQYNFFENIIFGIIISGFVAVFFNYFLPLNDFLILINFILSLIYIYRTRLSFRYNTDEIKIFIILSLLSFFQIYSSGFSDDLNHYHGGHITNSDNGNIIIGSNLLNDHFGYSTIWLITQSYLNINIMFLQSIHIVNSILFVGVLGSLLTEIYNNYKLKSKHYINFFCIFSTLFILIKYTRLKEFGVDRPATLIFMTLIFYFIKNFSIEKKGNEITHIYLFKFFFISLYLFFNKIIYLAVLIFPIFYLIYNKNYDFFLKKYFFCLVLISAILIAKNILVSGCIIYPIPFSCVNLSWTTEDYAQRLYYMTEIIAKNIHNGFNKEEYSYALDNLKWINNWFERTKVEIYEFLFTCLLSFVLAITALRNIKTNKDLFCKKILLYSILVYTILSGIIFLKAPVIRYQHQLFLCFFYLIYLFFFTNLKIKNYTIYIIIFALLFNISKNIKRISNDNFVNNPRELIKKIKWYREPVLVKKDGIDLYNGWIDAYPVGKNNLNDVKYKKFGIFKVLYR